MKKIISIMIVLLLISMSLISSFALEITNTEYRMRSILDKLADINQTTINAALSNFKDMNHWAREHVGKLTSLEIINGYPDGTFKPNNNIKADEFIKMVVMAMGYTPEAGDTYWAEPYIQIAMDEKLLDEGDITNYSKLLNREEMAKIIVRATMTIEEAPAGEDMAILRGLIKDYNRITDKYKNDVLIAYTMGLISGYPDMEFKGSNNSTRAEASVVIMRFLDPGLRQPATIDPNKTLVLKDYYDNEYLFHNTDQEVFNMAKVMTTLHEKSKGYTRLVYNPSNPSVSTSFFSSKKEEYLFANENIGTIPLAFYINLERENWGSNSDSMIYEMDVRLHTQIDELHFEVIETIFKSLFEMDYKDAIGEFNKVYRLTYEEYNNQFIFNDRIVIFRKPKNHEFYVSIGRKGYRK